MADPTHQALNTRLNQLGGNRPLKDGYRSIVIFAADPDVLFWEKSVTPPGMDGGDSNPQTTMHNNVWQTTAPRALKTLTPMSLTVAYNPSSYNSVLALINVETTITVYFSDNTRLSFYGNLQNFTPSDMVEGAQPEATATINPTNWDPTNNVEAGPLYGTGTA